MKRIFFALVLIPALGLVKLPAHAQTQAVDPRWCNESRNVDQIIAGCTLVLRDAKDALQQILALNRRGAAFVKKGDHDRAIADLTAIIAIHASAEAHEARGMEWQAKGDSAKAAADYEEAESRGMNTLDHYLRLALAHRNLNQFDKSMRDLNFALIADPNSATALYWRGLLYQRKGEHRAAVADFDAALRAGTESEKPVIAAARNRSASLLGAK